MSNRTLKQVNEIVGFSIKITEIQAGYKLSQNRDATDFHNITNELEKVGDSNSLGIAEEMKKTKKQIATASFIINYWALLLLKRA